MAISPVHPKAKLSRWRIQFNYSRNDQAKGRGGFLPRPLLSALLGGNHFSFIS